MRILALTNNRAASARLFAHVVIVLRAMSAHYLVRVNPVHFICAGGVEITFLPVVQEGYLCGNSCDFVLDFSDADERFLQRVVRPMLADTRGEYIKL